MRPFLQLNGQPVGCSWRVSSILSSFSTPLTLLVLVLLAVDAGPTDAGGEPRAVVDRADASSALGPSAPEQTRVEPAIPPAQVPWDVQKASDESIGAMLFRTLLVLGIVVMLAYISLNWGLRKLMGIKPPGTGGGVISVVERVALDQRKALFLIKAANEYLIVGGGDTGLNLITKVDPQEVERFLAEKRSGVTMSPLLQKLLSRKGSK